jgi:hypothetical protein
LVIASPAASSAKPTIRELVAFVTRVVEGFVEATRSVTTVFPRGPVWVTPVKTMAPAAAGAAALNVAMMVWAPENMLTPGK